MFLAKRREDYANSRGLWGDSVSLARAYMEVCMFGRVSEQELVSYDI